MGNFITSIVFVFLLTSFCFATEYRIASKIVGPTKQSFDIVIPLIKGRLPSEYELRKVANEIVQKYNIQRVNNLYIMFYLPGMKINAGAYATANQLNVKIQKFMLFGTMYQKFM